jgi:hypothetical protein
MQSKEAPMKIDITNRRRATVVAIATLAIVATAGGAASASDAAETRTADTPVPLESNVTVALPGTSETYVEMQDDGSYYDPSLGRRVSPKSLWPYQTGAVAGTSETYVDMQDDGSYFDPSLGRRVSPAG